MDTELTPTDDLDEIDDYAKMRRTLMGVPNVKAVVPMGVSGAIVSSGNTIDVALHNVPPER